jgi:hypothetical protein
VLVNTRNCLVPGGATHPAEDNSGYKTDSQSNIGAEMENNFKVGCEEDHCERKDESNNEFCASVKLFHLYIYLSIYYLYNNRCALFSQLNSHSEWLSDIKRGMVVPPLDLVVMVCDDRSASIPGDLI